MNPLIQPKKILIALLLACLPLSPTARAVVPAPDGGYPGQNTAEGQSALLHLAGGTYNTALGWASLGFNVTGNFNTGVGAATLLNNTASENTATGFQALFGNTTGGNNTATGYRALQDNTTGIYNTGTGLLALANNTEGDGNTATGYRALHDNTTGNNTTGIGYYAGHDITGDGNVCIGANVFGTAGVDNTTWIRNVYDSVATARAVYVNANNKIGTLASSRRYKNEISPMAKASEAIFSLRPVSFRYKKEVDPTSLLSFGLIAEEVAEVDPDLVTPDRDGKPETVRYEAVNAMLLNEFLKEHKAFLEEQRRVQKQEATISQLKSTVAEQNATIAQQQKGMEAVTARLNEQASQIQKVSAQLEASKFATGRIRRGGPASQVAKNP